MRLSLILLVLLSTLSVGAAHPTEASGQVVHIVDGDTFDIEIEQADRDLDIEILAFARGILANEYQGIFSALDTERTVTTDVTIGGDDNQILVLSRTLSSWSDTDPKTVSFEIWQMAETSTRVFKQYPNRFEETTLTIYTSDGRSVIGFARILARPSRLIEPMPGGTSEVADYVTYDFPGFSVEYPANWIVTEVWRPSNYLTL